MTHNGWPEINHITWLYGIQIIKKYNWVNALLVPTWGWQLERIIIYLVYKFLRGSRRKTWLASKQAKKPMLIILYWFLMVCKLENLADSVCEKVKKQKELVEFWRNEIMIPRSVGHTARVQTHTLVYS